MATVTLISKPSRVATNTSTNQELLDAKIRHPTITPIPPTTTPSRTPYPSPTLPSTCGAVQLGQPGTQKLNDSNAPKVLLQGTAILCTSNVILTGDEIFVMEQESMLDLDTGQRDPEHADLVFEVLGRMNFYSISEFNDAISQHWVFEIKELKVKEPPQPSYEQCKQQEADPNQMEIEPAYLCVITNGEHVSRVKLEKFDAIAGVISVEISFITWSEIVVRS